MIPLALTVADRPAFDWLQQAVAAHHYLHKPVDPRSRPMAYVLVSRIGRTAGEPVGGMIFGRPEATRCYRGGLRYGSQADVGAGRAAFDRWEVLNLARVWLDPRVQAGGELCRPELVPGFTDRRGAWRPSLASWLIGQALGRVGFDYLLAHPPCFLDEPYQIRAALSYCDTRVHRGTIYRVSGFKLARTNGDGIETWWTPAVAPLAPAQDAQVRLRSEGDGRAARIRAGRGEVAYA